MGLEFVFQPHFIVLEEINAYLLLNNPVGYVTPLAPIS
jgi:hypothetical protein